MYKLLYNYHKNVKNLKKCAIKIDLMKGYDMVNWSFIGAILQKIGIHPKFLEWIKKCITTLSFTMCINGELKGYLKCSRGLRQGNLLSPYLFVIAMKVLSRIFKDMTTKKGFEYH